MTSTQTSTQDDQTVSGEETVTGQAATPKAVTCEDVTLSLKAARDTALLVVEADTVAAQRKVDDDVAFTHAALTTRSAIRANLSLRTIGKANRAAKVGYTAAEDLRVLAMVGDVLNIPGDLPKGVTSRDVATLYRRQVTRKGADKIDVFPTADEHRAILDNAKASDRASAYRLVLDLVREKTANARKTQDTQVSDRAAATVAQASGEEQVTGQEPSPEEATGPNVGAMLATILEALESGVTLSDSDTATLAKINSLVS